MCVYMYLPIYLSLSLSLCIAFRSPTVYILSMIHLSHILHVWYIYLHLGHFWANVGKYSIHGASGYGMVWWGHCQVAIICSQKKHQAPSENFILVPSLFLTRSSAAKENCLRKSSFLGCGKIREGSVGIGPEPAFHSMAIDVELGGW